MYRAFAGLGSSKSSLVAQRGKNLAAQMEKKRVPGRDTRTGEKNNKKKKRKKKFG